MTILALDYGEKRIGVAVSDENGQFAKALDYITNKSEIKKIFAKDFPKNTKQAVINEARYVAKKDAKIEFKKVCTRLLYLFNIYYPDKLLIGIPTSIDPELGTPVFGQQAKKVQGFAKRLETCLKQHGISVEFIFLEESMSSKQAEDNLKTQGISTSNKIKERIDSESARILLDEYLHNGK